MWQKQSLPEFARTRPPGGTRNKLVESDRNPENLPELPALAMADLQNIFPFSFMRKEKKKHTQMCGKSSCHSKGSEMKTKSIP